MSGFILSIQADSDLDDITFYTLEVWGEAQTRQYMEGLLETLQFLSDKPNLGRRAHELGLYLKRYNYKTHIIFYEPTEEGIFIVRILSQRQDFEKQL